MHKRPISSVGIRTIYPQRLHNSESDEDDDHLTPYPSITPLDSPRESTTAHTRPEKLRKNVSFDVKDVPAYAMSSHRRASVSTASTMSLPTVSQEHLLSSSSSASSKNSVCLPRGCGKYQVKHYTIEEAVVIRSQVPALQMATMGRQLSPPISPTAVGKSKSVPTSARTISPNSSNTKTTTSSSSVRLSPILSTKHVQCPQCQSYNHSVLLGIWKTRNTPVYYCGNETSLGSSKHHKTSTTADMFLCGYVWPTSTQFVKQIQSVTLAYDPMVQRMMVSFKD